MEKSSRRRIVDSGVQCCRTAIACGWRDKTGVVAKGGPAGGTNPWAGRIWPCDRLVGNRNSDGQCNPARPGQRHVSFSRYLCLLLRFCPRFCAVMRRCISTLLWGLLQGIVDVVAQSPAGPHCWRNPCVMSRIPVARHPSEPRWQLQGPVRHWPQRRAARCCVRFHGKNLQVSSVRMFAPLSVLSPPT
jgi:hypothetical protein